MLKLPKQPKGFAGGQITQSQDTLIYIPLVLENTQKVNGFVRAVVNDSIGLSFCLAQDYKNYPQYGTGLTSTKFSSFMMVLDNNVFGHIYFDLTDPILFTEQVVSNGTSPRKLKLQSVGIDSGNNLMSGVISVCWISPSGNCNCGSGGCKDWAEYCNPCTASSCIYFDLASDPNPGWNSGPIGGGYPSDGGPTGGGHIPPYYPCVSTPPTLYPEPLPPCPPPTGGSGWNPSMVIVAESESSVIEYNSGPNIDLEKYKNCFGLVPSAGATYTIKLCADIPVNSNPNNVNTATSAGHAFLTLTKTNGSQSVTQNFGYYPWNGPLSLMGMPGPSKVVDDGEIEYNASLTMNVSESSFLSMFSAAQLYTQPFYDLNDYNCVNVALASFNSIRSNGISIPDTYSTIGAYFGKTPIGLYKILQYKKNHGDPEANNIEIGIFSSPPSHGPCN